MVLLSQNLNMFEIISQNELRYLSTLSAQILFDHFFTNVATRDNYLSNFLTICDWWNIFNPYAVGIWNR